MWAALGAVLGGITLGSAGPAHAQELDDITQDAMLRNARYCTQYFSRYERLNGIPKNLLMAISSNESGRYSDKAQMTLPWPWTINVDGKGYYFNTMHEAVTAARNAQLRGADNVDVGCMQISMKHHPDAFASLTDAFSPEKNVAYGAKFLREKYDEERSWKKAIAAYHSKTPSYGQKYYANIIRKWRNVLATIGGAFDVAPSEARVINVAANERSLGGRQRMTAGLFEETPARGKARAKSGIATMKIIKVTTRKDTGNRPEVLVIRPASAEMPAPNVALSQRGAGIREGDDFVMDVGRKPMPAAEKLTQEAKADVVPAADSPRVSSPRRGPNFIFPE